MAGNNGTEHSQGTWVFKKSDFAKFVRKMRIQPNSVILFRDRTITEEGLTAFGNAVQNLGIRGVILLVVNDVNEVRALDEHEMNKLGWFRSETIQKLFLKREGEVAEHPIEEIAKEEADESLDDPQS